MTETKKFEGYTIDDAMVIRDPGKFEGEMYYSPTFWRKGLEGFADEDVNGVYFFVLTADDKATWPELASEYGLAMEESESGFVSSRTYATKGEYQAILEMNEKEEAKRGDDEL